MILVLGGAYLAIVLGGLADRSVRWVAERCPVRYSGSVLARIVNTDILVFEKT